MYLRSFCIWRFLGWLVTWWERLLGPRHHSGLDHCHFLLVQRDLCHNKMTRIVKNISTVNQNNLLRIGSCWPTLFGHRGVLHLVLLVLSLIRDFARNWAGHIQFVDVQSGLAEWGHGWVHACIAIWGAAEGSQVKSFAPSDDGDVEGELAPTVWGWVLGDGERRRWGELSAGPGGGGRLSIQEFTVLTAGKE